MIIAIVKKLIDKKSKLMYNNKASGCSAVGSAPALGNTADRRRWRIKGGFVGVAVKISRVNNEQEILGTARGRAKQGKLKKLNIGV